MEVFMKKFALAGIAIFLALLFVTCDVPEFEDDADIEYTDVVYSPDGSTVTLYLDGVGVPVTKAQRALNKDLAMMGYDYLEAVFSYGTVAATPTTVARAAWEIGQAAGISGVYRTGSGVNYAAREPVAAGTATITHGAAIIFVGKKSDKTLLGIGALSHVDDVMLKDSSNNFDSTSFSPAGNTVLITTTTRSVTFTVQALLTNIAYDIPTGTPPAGNGVLDTGTSFVTAAGGTVSGTSPNLTLTTASLDNTLYQLNALGGTVYPIFNLPDPSAAPATPTPTPDNHNGFYGTIDATFTISGTTLGIAPLYLTSILQRTNILYTKRYPRYVERGQYTDIKLAVDTKTGFKITSHGGDTPIPSGSLPQRWVRTSDTAGSHIITMQFTTKPDSVGVFAILFRIPVIALTEIESTNGAENATWWNIRPGFGGNLYNLDSGSDAGGAILLSIGQTSLDWIDIKLADPAPGEIYEM